MRERGRQLRQGIGRGLGIRSSRASAPQLLRLERRQVGQGQPRRDGDHGGDDAGVALPIMKDGYAALKTQVEMHSATLRCFEVAVLKSLPVFGHTRRLLAEYTIQLLVHSNPTFPSSLLVGDDTSACRKFYSGTIVKPL